MHNVPLFQFLAAKVALEVPTALVTITNVSGSSMRNPGTHLAVSADGAWAGSLSGGCIEAAVVAEAIDSLTRGRPCEVRFGAGSRYIDIRLPCGGALDVLINPIASRTFARQALALFEQRTPFVLTLPLETGQPEIEARAAAWRTQRAARAFRVAHLPPLSLLIIGHGANVEALHAQAEAATAGVRVMTPDRDLVSRLDLRGADVILLQTPHQDTLPDVDAWTSIAFLFHDHDWEIALMKAALASPAFYVGAMGSRQTQRARAEALSARGVPADHIERLRAPIGLIPSSRDPEVLALSTLAEIVRDFQRLRNRPDIMLTCSM